MRERRETAAKPSALVARRRRVVPGRLPRRVRPGVRRTRIGPAVSRRQEPPPRDAVPASAAARDLAGLAADRGRGWIPDRRAAAAAVGLRRCVLLAPVMGGLLPHVRRPAETPGGETQLRFLHLGVVGRVADQGAPPAQRGGDPQEIRRVLREARRAEGGRGVSLAWIRTMVPATR